MCLVQRQYRREAKAVAWDRSRHGVSEDIVDWHRIQADSQLRAV